MWNIVCNETRSYKLLNGKLTEFVEKLFFFQIGRDSIWILVLKMFYCHFVAFAVIESQYDHQKYIKSQKQKSPHYCKRYTWWVNKPWEESKKGRDKKQ